MAVISLQRISITICLISTIVLFLIGDFTGGYDNLLFVSSKVDSNASVSKADDAEFLITYETISTGMIRAVSNIETKILGVNYRHANILGCKMKGGSFFTKAAQDEKRKVVVLNETVAFKTFGNFDISGNEIELNGEFYMVIGVIEDGLEEPVVYLPASLVGGIAGDFIAVVDVEEKTLADLKTIGISENKFHFVNLDKIAGVVRNKALLAVLLFGSLVLVWLMNKGLRHSSLLFKQLQEIGKEKYFSEVIGSPAAKQFLLFGILIILGISATLVLFLKSVEIILQWRAYADALSEIATTAFGGRIQLLQKLYSYSNIAFAVFSGGIVIGFINVKRDKQGV